MPRDITRSDDERSSYESYERFTEVYAISDLHLTAGDGVDHAGVDHLGKTVGALARRARKLAPSRVALVINGDTVDFLDIPPYAYFDAHSAPGKLGAVFDANAAFWSALKEFAQLGTVVLTLGNHDLELAMPACRAMLRERLSGSLVLAFEGTGYRCRVGRSTALFLHGNNEDPWNTVDYEHLGRIAAAVAADVEPAPWHPNEGTKLVIEVINAQKRTHPFIEYLKPETAWLFALIAKLGFGGLARQYRTLAPRQIAASTRYKLRGLGPQADYLSDVPGAHELPTTRPDGDTLLLRADQRFRAGGSVLASPGAGAETLGMRDVLGHRRATDDEIRAHIVDSLTGDNTFEPTQSDPIYRRLASKLGPRIDWVVCGHTHLRRAYQDGDRIYFNSGTWMRLLDLHEPASIESQFPQVLRGLDAKTRAELDEIRWSSAGQVRPLVSRQPTVVVLRATTEGAEGWLADADSELAFEPLARTQMRVRR